MSADKFVGGSRLMTQSSPADATNSRSCRELRAESGRARMPAAAPLIPASTVGEVGRGGANQRRPRGLGLGPTPARRWGLDHGSPSSSRFRADGRPHGRRFCSLFVLYSVFPKFQSTFCIFGIAVFRKAWLTTGAVGRRRFGHAQIAPGANATRDGASDRRLDPRRPQAHRQNPQWPRQSARPLAVRRNRSAEWPSQAARRRDSDRGGVSRH